MNVGAELRVNQGDKRPGCRTQRDSLLIAASRRYSARRCREFLFDNPGVRFLRRFRIETTMRVLASPLFQWLMAAAGDSRRIHSRLSEAEFPAPSQAACRSFEGFCRSWNAGRASTDALRSLNNSVNLKNQNDISSIRETFTPFAWRFSTKGRSQLALSGQQATGEASSKNVLAAFGCFFYGRRKTGCKAIQFA